MTMGEKFDGLVFFLVFAAAAIFFFFWIAIIPMAKLELRCRLWGGFIRKFPLLIRG